MIIMAEKKHVKISVEKKGQKKIEISHPQAPKKEIDPWQVLSFPHMAEKSMALVDTQNKMVFIVKRESTKDQIKQAFEKLFEVKVESVNTEITITGEKRAFIKLQSGYSAADIATRLGIL